MPWRQLRQSGHTGKIRWFSGGDVYKRQEEDYPRNTALWNPVKERLQEYICSLAEKGPDDSLLCEMASRLEEAADEMYLCLLYTSRCV